ncbi:MAG: DUF373 family protein [Candidatus Geothermarchaeales archaeon]
MNSEMGTEKIGFNRTLILNIDRDADLEMKAGIKTPIIGREDILKASSELLLADPEEADGNALFASVKIHDQLECDEGEAKEVAAISGSPEGSLQADRKLGGELQMVLSKFPADNVILVTDGFSDEEIMPIVSSSVKISSVQHVVVKHSRSVEETYALIERYLRMIWNEAPYRVYFIGVPGVILLLTAILVLFGLAEMGAKISLLIIGGAMAIKGFGIDDYVSSMRKAPSIELLKTFSLVATIISIAVGFYISYLNINLLPEFMEVLINPPLFWRYGAYLVGKFLENFLIAFLVGALIYFSGTLLYNWIVGTGRVLRYVVVTVSIIIMYVVGNEAAAILIEPARGMSLLLLIIGLGIAILFLISIITYVILRRIE